MPRQSRFDDENEYDGPSKTQVKQAMHGLQDIGTELLKLSGAQLNGIGMEPRLREALREHGRMPTREAKRRHMQFIGRLIREGDQEGFLRRALDQIKAGTTRVLAEAELWRERLLEDDAAMTQWIELYPQTEVQPLRNLVRNARRELAKLDAAEPESSTARQKSAAYKSLFQALRVIVAANDAA